MRPNIPLVLLATAAIIVAAGAGAAAQQPPATPEVREENDKIVLQNDQITVWFHGKKPMLKLFPAGNDSNETDAAFGYKFHQVVEYRDLNENGLPEQTEVLASLNLEKASAWDVVSTEQNGTITLNLTLEAPVKIAGGLAPEDLTLPDDRTARVSLIFTIGGAAIEVDAGDVNLTVPTHAIKYDFVVSQWPSLGATDSRLALDAHVTGALEASEILGVNGATVSGNQTGNETAVGLVAWTDSAIGTNVDGEEVDVPVVTTTAPLAAEGEGEAEANATTMTRLVHTYDAASLATLLHDPVIGLASAQGMDGAGVGENVDDAINNVPGIGALGLVAGIAGAAALVATRRRG